MRLRSRVNYGLKSNYKLYHQLLIIRLAGDGIVAVVKGYYFLSLFEPHASLYAGEKVSITFHNT